MLFENGSVIWKTKIRLSRGMCSPLIELWKTNSCYSFILHYHRSTCLWRASPFYNPLWSPWGYGKALKQTSVESDMARSRVSLARWTFLSSSFSHVHVFGKILPLNLNILETGSNCLWQLWVASSQHGSTWCLRSLGSCWLAFKEESGHQNAIDFSLSLTQEL